MTGAQIYRRIVAAFLLWLYAVPVFAQSSFLDNDFWCRTYGCVVVHSGAGSDIYDNWQFASNSCCVPAGSPMIAFSTNVPGTNLTGTLTDSTTDRPTALDSNILGISQNGTTVTQTLTDDGDGYLDAADSFTAFEVNTITRLLFDPNGRQYSHSFFITSRNTRFSLRATSSITNATGDFASTLNLDDISLNTRFTQTGSDDGFNFGSATNVNNISNAIGINDLGDVTAPATTVMNFNRNAGIRAGNSTISNQVIRLDFLYTLPTYNFSMGTGSMEAQVVFDFHNET